MTVDLIQSIKETEHEAAAIAKQSLEEERRILAQAKEDGKQWVQNVVQEAERQGENMRRQAEADSVTQVETLQEQVCEECRLIRENAEKLSGMVVEELLERIIARYAGR